MLVLQIASVFAVHLGHALGVGFWGVVHFLGRGVGQPGGVAGRTGGPLRGRHALPVVIFGWDTSQAGWRCTHGGVCLVSSDLEHL